MRAFLLLLALAWLPPAWAFPPPKAVPLDVSGDTVVIVKSFPAKVTAPPGADFYIWSYPDAVKATSADNVLTVTEAPNGAHRINVVSLTLKIDFDKKTVEKVKDTGSMEINVGAVPAPPGPTPPGPAPVGALRVLIVYESEDLAKMPAAQQDILYAKKPREWLDANCGPDGTIKAWRIWDKDVDASREAAHWKKMLGVGTHVVPRVVMQRGSADPVFAALPADVDSFLALAGKYKGAKR